NIEAQTGLSSAQRIRTQYQTVQDKVLADYLHTGAGIDSLRTNYDAKSGGIPGIANTIVSATRRIVDSYLNQNSAKAVNKGGTFPPNQFQQQLINNYRR
ncbi:TPA: hypothetical protein ACNCHT_004668, partial [Escherichia coli]